MNMTAFFRAHLDQLVARDVSQVVMGFESPSIHHGLELRWISISAQLVPHGAGLTGTFATALCRHIKHSPVLTTNLHNGVLW